MSIPTMEWYIDNEWQEGDGLPGPAYRRRYGIEPHSEENEPKHFLMDSKGDLYEVSEELANQHASLHPSSTATVDMIDKETNTIYFSTPLPQQVKA